MSHFILLLLWEEWRWRQKEGGACGIRANTKEDIREIQAQTDLPIIGIVKRDYEDSSVYITPTRKEADELMEVHPEIIAFGRYRKAPSKRREAG